MNSPKSHYRVVVIGGGIVGASALYHLARRGWSEVLLIERAELTAGSTWHAAAGFHALNNDPNIAALQSYTIKLYQQIKEESGQSVGLQMTGGYSLATTPVRWEWLKAEWARHQSLGLDARIVTPEEILADCPIVEPTGLLGGLFDPNEGHIDPHGTTHALAGAARKHGAHVVLRNRVLALTPHPEGGWRVDTEQGPLTSEHVVNAAGLWARRVGRMAGVDLPVTPMQHHYLITDDIPVLAARHSETPAVTDLEGFTYLQQERNGVLLGVYERNPRHWKTAGADWDYGMELIPEDIERISEELSIAFTRFPVLRDVGIRKWVNGAFTFTPDGNPLVGPVPGRPNFWAACGCMAGFSQGGAIGLVLANWIIDGDPGADVSGMDVARYGAFASNDQYLRDTTAQFYARRFAMAYPNEELPAGRPLKMTPSHDAQKDVGACAGVAIENLSESWLGFSLSGPHSREILGRLTSQDVSDAALPFLGCRSMDVGLTQAIVARLSLTGELGFELTVPAAQQRALWGALLEHGAPLGMRPIGMRAQDSLRLEKGYGVWSREFAQSYTPAMSGLDRFIAYDKGDFLGRAAARKERETGSDQGLVLLAIDALDADVTGFEPVWVGGQRVGFVTSGAYGHHVKQSLALAYVDRAIIDRPAPLEVHVVGERRPARLLAEPPYDPQGRRLRG